MEKQNLFIHNNLILYDILFELKHLVTFNIKKINNFEIEKQKFQTTDLVVSDRELKMNNQILIHQILILVQKLLLK